METIMPWSAWFIVGGVAFLLIDVAFFIGVSLAFFFGVSMVLVGLLMTTMTLEWSTASVLAALLGSALAYIGWRPLENWRKRGAQTVIGRYVSAASEITKTSGTIVWNGAELQTRMHLTALRETIPAGDTAFVVDVVDSILYVV